MLKALIVEDDKLLAESLKAAFAAGYGHPSTGGRSR